MTKSSGISFEVDDDDVDAEDEDDGRRIVTVSSNSFKSNVVVCLLAGIWTFTVVSTLFSTGRMTMFVVLSFLSSRSGVDVHDWGRFLSSTSLPFDEDKFCVDVQDREEVFAFDPSDKFGDDAATSSPPLFPPCSL